MKIAELASKLCIISVTKKEYNDFIDPILDKLSVQNISEDDIDYTFHYSSEDEKILTVRTESKGETNYWLNK